MKLSGDVVLYTVSMPITTELHNRKTGNTQKLTYATLAYRIASQTSTSRVITYTFFRRKHKKRNLPETLIAELASERFFPCVRPVVSREPSRDSESLRAYVAPVRIVGLFRMGALVRLVRTLGSEHFVTERALDVLVVGRGAGESRNGQIGTAHYALHAQVRFLWGLDRSHWQRSFAVETHHVGSLPRVF